MSAGNALSGEQGKRLDVACAILEEMNASGGDAA
jgi:hypothetical protein